MALSKWPRKISKSELSHDPQTGGPNFENAQKTPAARKGTMIRVGHGPEPVNTKFSCSSA